MNEPAAARDPAWLAEYQALVEGAGLVDFRQRMRIAVGGADRVKFLNGFCTSDVKRLSVGEGCEAFITSAQGKTIGHVQIYCEHDALLVETVSGQAKRLIAHLDRYVIREDVVLHDRSTERAAVLLAGRHAGDVLQQLGVAEIPLQRLQWRPATIANCEVCLRCVDFVRPWGILVESSAESWKAVGEELLRQGGRACGHEAFEAARIEAGFPWFGRDISERNLPQEVGRDELAISFTKGCYLGQETVARIDALGHVNRVLCGVRWQAAQVPSSGEKLSDGGQEVGEVTSATYSPRLKSALALAYVKRGHQAQGTQLESPLGPAEVVQLPLP
jgi:folate-binding protein YgfZ